MRRKIEIKNHLLFIIFLGCAGCTLFQPTSDRTHLFEIGFRNHPSVILSKQALHIHLALNHFPEYLNCPFIITKIGPHELKSNPLYRWATPLSESILHMVRHSIQQSFPNAWVYEFPNDTIRAANFIIRLDIDTFEVDETSHQIVLAGLWALLDEKQELLYRSPFTFCEPFKNEENRYSEITAKIEQIILRLGDAVTQKMVPFLPKDDDKPKS
ncbi:MAG: PqiC family protein [Puniceicoccales bacterium]|jgi:uncharacterized lipoprotein YmbA|nr:PqiC family protein [Puniceicoccales bacterium]